jgi:hypothetical protein
LLKEYEQGPECGYTYQNDRQGAKPILVHLSVTGVTASDRNNSGIQPDLDDSSHKAYLGHKRAFC